MSIKPYFDKLHFNNSLPNEINYVKLGYNTPVRDQGQCGSCFAMSAIEAVESAFYKITKKTVILSAQQIVSCDNEDSGCNGGLMEHVFDWIPKNGGLCLESDYKYISGLSQNNEVCLTTCKKIPMKILTMNVNHKETDLQDALVNLGPLAVAIEADQMAFRFYNSGVITGSCGAKLDHGVLLMGYGTDNSNPEKPVDYWLLKNSWSDQWGEKGYFRIQRNKKTWSKVGECGIAADASYPVLNLS